MKNVIIQGIRTVAHSNYLSCLLPRRKVCFRCCTPIRPELFSLHSHSPCLKGSSPNHPISDQACDDLTSHLSFLVRLLESCLRLSQNSIYFRLRSVETPGSSSFPRLKDARQGLPPGSIETLDDGRSLAERSLDAMHEPFLSPLIRPLRRMTMGGRGMCSHRAITTTRDDSASF